MDVRLVVGHCPGHWDDRKHRADIAYRSVRRISASHPLPVGAAHERVSLRTVSGDLRRNRATAVGPARNIRSARPTFEAGPAMEIIDYILEILGRRWGNTRCWRYIVGFFAVIMAFFAYHLFLD
jgi:hypothetical protein